MAARRFSVASLRGLVEGIAQAAGLRPEDARVLADSLLYAELSGISTHGVRRLRIYIERILRGLIDAGAQPEVVQRKGGAAVVDAHNCIGQVAGVFAMGEAMRLACEHGLGGVTVRQSQHFGAAGFYCKQAAEADLIGIALTNAEPAMPPWGSFRAYFGTNPISLGCPTDREFPIIVDLSTSQVARGNIIAAAQRGEAIPDNWALDAEGNPTTDPQAALEGSVLPLGGVKGYALALVVEVLAGVLSGAGFGRGVRSMYKDFSRPANVGHFLAAIDPSAFMPLDEFKERVGRMIDEIHASPPRPGFERIYVPGERSHLKRIGHARKGIELAEDVIADLRALAEEAGVSWPE